jgi:hypothetical protein
LREQRQLITDARLCTAGKWAEFHVLNETAPEGKMRAGSKARENAFDTYSREHKITRKRLEERTILPASGSVKIAISRQFQNQAISTK